MCVIKFEKSSNKFFKKVYHIPKIIMGHRHVHNNALVDC